MAQNDRSHNHCANREVGEPSKVCHKENIGLGPNLAKGDFLAKYSRSEVETGEKSICHADGV